MWGLGCCGKVHDVSAENYKHTVTPVSQLLDVHSPASLSFFNSYSFSNNIILGFCYVLNNYLPLFRNEVNSFSVSEWIVLVF